MSVHLDRLNKVVSISQVWMHKFPYCVWCLELDVGWWAFCTFLVEDKGTYVATAQQLRNLQLRVT